MSSRSALAVLAVILIGAVFRFAFIGRQSFHIEEAYSFLESQKPAGILLADCARDVHPPLHLLLLHWWTLASPGEAGARSLSAVAGIASLLLVYLIGRRLSGAATALTAIVIAAPSPFLLWYSQETRP